MSGYFPTTNITYLHYYFKPYKPQLNIGVVFNFKCTRNFISPKVLVLVCGKMLKKMKENPFLNYFLTIAVKTPYLVVDG